MICKKYSNNRYMWIILMIVVPCIGINTESYGESYGTQDIPDQEEPITLELIPDDGAVGDEEQDDQEQNDSVGVKKIISNIVIRGNMLTAKDAIMSYIPYRVGDLFDPAKSKQLIRNLYTKIPRFSNITVLAKPVEDNRIEVYIDVEEKSPLKGVAITGNSALSESEIRKKINFDLPAIEEAQLKIFTQQLQKLYLEKGYCDAQIVSEFQVDEQSRASVNFAVNEGHRSAIRRIKFEGNKSVAEKKLRSIIFTQEDWLLGFMSKAGIYHPERIEADKYMIEQHYQNQGFLRAKVVQVKQDKDPRSKDIDLTFVVDEGVQYTVGTVSAPGNELLDEKAILSILPIVPGAVYSREAIAQSIKQLESLWGSRGYIFSHVEPAIQPNEDTKTVDVTFYSDAGEQVYLNRITIRGNKKTRDKVVRRKILLQEGGLLTNDLMEFSKNSVQSLGFFDQREGVNWKINKKDATTVDLDLMLKEVKTGNFGFQMGYGGAFANTGSPDGGLNGKLTFSDRNWRGQGLDMSTDASWSKKEQTFSLHVGQPWLFDRPLYGGVDAQHRRPSYDMFRNIEAAAINERTTSGSVTTGVILRSYNQLLNGVQALGSVGVDHVGYYEQPRAAGITPEAQVLYQQVLDKEFKAGAYAWIGGSLEQDVRNHPMHTSQGHKWKINTRIAIPHGSADNIGYAKVTADASWYTPLIGDHDLIFKARFFAGAVMPLLNHVVPYCELFNIGGPSSVRGFLFGSISPRFEGDPIGGGKALYWNFELLFPVMQDMSIKGAFFYDGGAGFSNPHVTTENMRFVMDNNFDYRHAVGFSVRVLNPMPVRVDWGFKIDPRKGEPSNEVHFGMNYDW